MLDANICESKLRHRKRGREYRNCEEERDGRCAVASSPSPTRVFVTVNKARRYLATVYQAEGGPQLEKLLTEVLHNYIFEGAFYRPCADKWMNPKLSPYSAHSVLCTECTSSFHILFAADKLVCAGVRWSQHFLSCLDFTNPPTRVQCRQLTVRSAANWQRSTLIAVPR
jgi:hypothetical protein